MKKIKTFLISTFLCLICIDILWYFFPSLSFRSYSLMLPIPILLLCYFIQNEVKSFLYVLALLLLILADYFFIISDNEFRYGVLATSLGLSLYGIIILRQSHYISTRRILINTVPFLLIYTIPFLFFIDNISDDIFGVVVFYTFAVGYFSFMSIMTFFSKKSPITGTLLIAGISTFLMAILYGIYLFVDKNNIYAIMGNSLFMISNYSMWLYMSMKDSESLQAEENLFKQ